MPVYRVYYASELSQRKFTRLFYTSVYAHNRLQALNLAFDLQPNAIKWGAVVLDPYTHPSKTVNPPHTEPKPTQKQASELIRVSHWRNGERKDKPAGQAYKVISRHTRFDTEWVTYDMGLGKHHTVKAEYTKAAA